jgi:nicotinamidase-related amidase
MSAAPGLGRGPVTALLVIDMQADFFDDPAMERQREELVAGVNLAAARAHEANAMVVEIRTVHTPDGSSWSLNMLEDDQGMAIEGSPGAGAAEGLELGSTVLVEKTRDSAFHATRLAELLASRGIGSVALCGVSTESCVATTASDAYAHDLHVVLVEDAIAAADDHAHRHALDRLSTQYRYATVPAAEVDFAAPSDAAMA